MERDDMCDFKPGDEVVCVDAKDHGWLPGDLPMIGLREGETYTVKGVGPNYADDIAVYLVETRNGPLSGVDWGYSAFRFRKVQRRDLSAWLETATDFEEPKRKSAKTDA